MAEIIPRARIPEGSGVGALPGVRVAQPASREPQLQTLAVLGRGVQEFAERQQKINDTTALMQARNDLSALENETFSPNNPDGIGKYRGKDALGAADALVPKIDERIGQIRERLTANQRLQFEGIAGNFRAGFGERLNSYMDREHTGYLEAEQKSAIDNMGNDAVAAGVGGDFAQQDLKATELIGMVDARAAANGWGAQQTEAARRAVVSNVRARTITGMAASQPLKAWEYYQSFGSELTAADRERVEGVIQPVVQDATAQAQADAILTGHSVVDPSAVDIDEQIDALEGTAKNPNSSAVGAGQFLKDTWLQVIRQHRPDLAAGKSEAEILALRSDRALGREMIQRYRQDNAAALASQGIPLSGTNLYAAHHFGPGGGAKFARASDDTPMSKILSPRELAANEYLQGKTVGEVKANWAQRGLAAAAASGPDVSGAPPATEADAIEAANGIADPQQRRAVKQKISEHFALRRSREAETDKALSESAYTAISQNTDPSRPLREIITPEQFAYFQKKGQIETLENLRTKTLTGQLVQDNPMLVDALYREAVLSPNTFKNRDLYKNADQLSTSTLADLLSKQTKTADPAKQADWASQEDRMNLGYAMLGLGREGDAKGSGAEKKNQPRDQARGEFRLAYMQAEKAALQSSGGKKLTPEQSDALLKTVAKQVAGRMKANTLFTKVDGKNVGLYSQAAAYELQITDADRTAVRNAYRAKYGHNPTDAYVTQYVIDARKTAPATQGGQQ